jgi:DNA sulfur modification protein DndC
MSQGVTQNKNTAFINGVGKAIDLAIKEIIDLYLSDDIPWVIGYSGGKDSTAVLQLAWMALKKIPEKERKKKIHVISTDTLVENPIVSGWVAKSLTTMKKSAKEQGIPIVPRQLTPEVQDTFWVNLIGKGYPAPRHKFRWCTARLKIAPSNKFITEMVQTHGETILLLGTRKAESSSRAHRMKEMEKKMVRDMLVPNANLPNAYVYTPISEWSNDDVWLFLMQYENPWNFTNNSLLGMYQGASADGECPLVVDSSTPSCGDSRFGCWVCTLVDKDKSMAAMIQNDAEKEWMRPLIEFRELIDFRKHGIIENDRQLRDFRRMHGNIQLFMDRLIHGPYKQSTREDFLRALLEAQQFIQDEGPEHVRNLELITLRELREIRRIWVVEKHELEDRLPSIYEEVTGKPFSDDSLDDNLAFGANEMEVLKTCCKSGTLEYELARELIDIERRYSTKIKRSGLFNDLEIAVKRSFYEDEDEAEAIAKRKEKAKKHENETFEHFFDRQQDLLTVAEDRQIYGGVE